MANDEASRERRADLGLRASDTDRERVAELLRTAAGQGRISLDELEERLEAAYAAKTYGELVPVTADLPVSDAVPQSTSAAALSAGPSSALVVGEQPGVGRGTAIAIMSGANRGGRWIVPKRMHIFTFWGGSVIDLRDALFESGTTAVYATAIMGGVQIIAPEGVNVNVAGIGIMGGFAESARPEAPSRNAPMVHVKGFAFWGGVNVKHVKRKRQQEIEG